MRSPVAFPPPPRSCAPDKNTPHADHLFVLVQRHRLMSLTHVYERNICGFCIRMLWKYRATRSLCWGGEKINPHSGYFMLDIHMRNSRNVVFFCEEACTGEEQNSSTQTLDKAHKPRPHPPTEVFLACRYTDVQSVTA